MKLLHLTIALLASSVSAQNTAPSQTEIGEWYTCLNTFLNGFGAGRTGSAAGCTYWTCIENVAQKYNRGGALAVAGNVVDKACVVGGVIPVRNLPHLNTCDVQTLSRICC
ncbi:hypothetical protein N7528_004875 [Penicillium herquei]|nr:hypothetical protein N7528_004875 [Penicillium herquei]